ncbi:nucleotide triphosphate diphosphatase NUDT15 [Ferrimonas balearica]|uniref:nucleotide triphosphate diphosphatase NUDT15 n=1 Tax=Ferrimonas balearica TaxID=44012 RepID=UPI001C55B340|nr:NUDIX hydrolase [Ferrimonas balearica]MBW3163142.1 NUDIX domain-containing protein [Ferrimonas balearica]
MNQPRVGIGIIVRRADGKILIGKRTGAHAPYWSIPGGHLELGESFEAAAIREIEEETGLRIADPQVIAVTNNLRTFREEGKHYVSVCLLAHHQGEKPVNREPDKCEGWVWVEPDDLPHPHFDASEQSVACYLANQVYLGAS